MSDYEDAHRLNFDNWPSWLQFSVFAGTIVALVLGITFGITTLVQESKDGPSYTVQCGKHDALYTSQPDRDTIIVRCKVKDHG